MRLQLLSDADAVACRGAALIAEWVREASDRRTRFVMAVSGGNTPWQMLRVLAAQEVCWDHVHVVQTDERIAPCGSPDRNWTHVQECLLNRVSLSPEHSHPMPVENTPVSAAAARYAATLERLAGDPPVLDLVHLGLGRDGHTASLVPGDPVMNATGADVAVTGEYHAYRRMTLTFPVINRARRILWVVTGAEKAEVLSRFLALDAELPASRVAREQALVLADRAAAARIDSGDAGQLEEH